MSDMAQRAQLLSRRARHVADLATFRAAALDYWRSVAELERESDDPEALARARRLATQIDDICHMLDLAILAIDDELAEDERV